MLLCLKTVVQLRTEEQKPDPFSPFDQLSVGQAREGGGMLRDNLSVSPSLYLSLFKSFSCLVQGS